MEHQEQTGREAGLKNTALYDSGAIQVIILACAVIFISVVITGIMSYSISKEAAVKKLKTRDLPQMVRSISSKIDGRLQRAVETSVELASDPAVMDWVNSRETDKQLEGYARTELINLAKDYDYSNSFIVSSLTSHYWAENGTLIGNVSPTVPEDSWFYTTLRSKQQVTLNLDYNRQRHQTSVFVNTLMGEISNPVAIVGVGLSLDEIAAEFASAKYGTASKLWLIDQNGKVCLSDNANDDGQYITAFLPPMLAREIVDYEDVNKNTHTPVVTEYMDSRGELMDLVYQPLTSAHWTLVFQIPRDESMSFLAPMRTNTVVTAVITIILLLIIFYVVSRRIADPYKRALQLNAELERQVANRTQELKEQHEKIMDSIDYAQMIQEAMLPSAGEMNKVFSDHFMLWQPRDVVGGDFYWARDFSHGRLFMIGDCTGHGVPGALMTMAVMSMIDQIVNNITQDDPALIIQELNRLLYQTFQDEDGQKRLNEGLDAGVCYIPRTGPLLYAGAKIALYQVNADGIKIHPGIKRSIGHRKFLEQLDVTNQVVSYHPTDAFYLSTDGYRDQNDAEHNYSFGAKRFRSLLTECTEMPMADQKAVFEEKLTAYRQGEEQRDDITVLSFRLGKD